MLDKRLPLPSQHDPREFNPQPAVGARCRQAVTSLRRYPAEILQRLDNSHSHEIERVNDPRFVLGFIASDLNHITASPTP